jgi:hypothetical protein
VADPSTGNAAWFGSVRENGACRRLWRCASTSTSGRSTRSRAWSTAAPRFPRRSATSKTWSTSRILRILPPEAAPQPRERLLAIADTYFDTVERNDGQVFARSPRIARGLKTASAPPPRPRAAQASAANIASGCREQFELGLYRINKRVRRVLLHR